MINDYDALTIWKNNENELKRQLEQRRLADSEDSRKRPLGRLFRFAAMLLFLRR